MTPKIRSKRTVISILFLLFMLFIYAAFPVPVYWTEDAGYFRPVLVFYAILSSAAFYFVIGNSLEKSRFSAIPRRFFNIIRKREILVLLVFLAAIKVATIYANPIWIMSDESFHIHRGQALLIYAGSSTGLLSDTLGVETSQLQGSFNRYPPLSMVVEGVSLALFGGINAFHYVLSSGLSGIQEHFILDEMAVRFPSLIFTLLTFILVFKLTGLYYGRKTSVFAALLAVLFPSYFMLSSSAYLTTGITFFATLSAYLLMKYEKTGKPSYAILTALAVSVGALYERPLIFFAALILFYFLFFSKRRSMINILKYAIIVGMVTVPYYLMVQVYANIRPFGFILPSLLKLSALMVTLPFQMTFPLTLIAILSIFLMWNKTPLSRFCVIWFVLWYLFFSLDVYPSDRFIVPSLIPLAILSSSFILSLPRKTWPIKPEKAKNIIMVLAVAFLLLENAVLFYGTDDIRSKYVINYGDIQIGLSECYGLKNNNFPYRETTSYLKPLLNKSDNLATIRLDEDSFFDLAHVFQFYMRNSDGIQSRNVFEFTPANASDNSVLYSYLKGFGVSHIILPDIDYARFRNVLPESYTEKDLEDLQAVIRSVSSSGLFSLERKFYSGTNGFLVFRLA